MEKKISIFIILIGSLIAAIIIVHRVDLFLRGGLLMVPIIFCSIVSIALIIDKVSQFSRASCDPDKFLAEICVLIERQRIKECIDLCNKKTSALSRVLRAGIMKYDQDKDEIKDAMEENCLIELSLLENRVELLAMIAYIAPLIGFLGTILGLMKVLKIVQAKEAVVGVFSFPDLMTYLWQACVCAAAGMIVAIPAIMSCQYFDQRLKTLFQEIERSSIALTSFLVERRKSL